MDILKVLSRGIKKPAQPTGPNATGSRPAPLPSAGTKPQPQLFHDHVGPARAQKRKRTSDDEDGDGSAEDLPEVDFFAPRDVSVKAPRVEPEPAPQPQAAEEAPQPSREMSEEDRRQILRSHRLKYTLLAGSLTREDERKQKKSKRKAKAEEKDKKPGFYPRPLESFSELRGIYGVSHKLAENLAREKYKEPTEVQLGSLPLLLRPSTALPDHDVPEHDIAPDFMAVAPTGSGKTISFLIPAIDRILKRREKEGLERIHELETVVVAPTRELAFQIVNEGRKLTMGTGLRVVQMKKGMEIVAEEGRPLSLDEDSESESDEDEASESESEGGDDDDRKRPLAKADILVTTPLALVNFLTNDPSKGTRVLPTVRTLILDEADVLLDPIFLEQTTAVWSACTNPALQATFWSATMPSNIETLIKTRLSATTTVPRPLVRLVVGLKDAAVPNITHKLLYTASEAGKLLAIRQLLRPATADPTLPSLRPPFLVFTQSIERASALESELRYDIPLEAGGPSRIASLHSGLSDPARTSIMKRFRAGEIWVLITTDVLARGVDFAGVNGIVNYDFPPSSATYVHRAGRTGRAGREGGIAVTLYTKEDIPHAKTVANVIAASDRQAGKTGDAAGVQKWLLDALPDVSKEDKKRLKRGVDSRKSGSKAKISSKSGWERRKDENRKGAIEASRKRKAEGKRSRKAHKDANGGEDGEWGGFED